MSETNPRFPHWCRITRKIASGPLEEEGGFTALPDDYDPLGDYDEDVDENANEQQNETEETSEEENAGEGTEVKIIYEGECRSYEKNTTSDKGEVINSQRGLSLPVNQSGWDARGVVPQEGDEVVVVHGTTHKEYGRVIDKNVATASFAGTHLIWRYGRE